MTSANLLRNEAFAQLTEALLSPIISTLETRVAAVTVCEMCNLGLIFPALLSFRRNMNSKENLMHTLITRTTFVLKTNAADSANRVSKWSCCRPPHLIFSFQHKNNCQPKMTSLNQLVNFYIIHIASRHQIECNLHTLWNVIDSNYS